MVKKIMVLMVNNDGWWMLVVDPGFKNGEQWLIMMIRF